ncbi:DUF732 domain-containing protein [Nocardia macrotermitis]|uniref:DUF732 domain-containing protein n=1 Tax=Nocardia macrotermitis TaxID=2585198 RepID=A0A7K0D9M2_9NOCA|nr:DUF732 domain-containing protein [Nocardia macrotermitis]MQY22398.1 hypothetical protein [Nocardia macrotermitis]
MLRTSGKASGLAGRGAAAGVAVTIASVLLLAGCGGNDSTASSTPTLRTSTTTAAPTSTTTVASSATASTTKAAPATTTTELPQPAVTPTLTAPKLTAKDQAYLDALKARGISVSYTDIALSVGDYICKAEKSGVSQQEVLTYVNAMAGQDPSYDPNKMPIAQLGQAYVAVANQTYCK